MTLVYSFDTRHTCSTRVLLYFLYTADTKSSVCPEKKKKTQSDDISGKYIKYQIHYELLNFIVILPKLIHTLFYTI